VTRQGYQTLLLGGRERGPKRGRRKGNHHGVVRGKPTARNALKSEASARALCTRDTGGEKGEEQRTYGGWCFPADPTEQKGGQILKCEGETLTGKNGGGGSNAFGRKDALKGDGCPNREYI